MNAALQAHVHCSTPHSSQAARIPCGSASGVTTVDGDSGFDDRTSTGGATEVRKLLVRAF